MRIATKLPRQIETIDNVWIPLSDGVRLSARIWLPEGAEQQPVPAILEYLPYRKDDGTASQDATRHPYFAAHGYAAVRVDLRGTGDSDGILLDEYLAQEQDDALEVITWLADQPWCTGDVGMIGYSWGGFNGLQVAARRPSQLKAVVSIYSTDDRYLDDCHYMGGCLLGSDMLKWATWMRAYNALPPDPRFRDDWREVWLERLDKTPPFIEAWMSHPDRDEFWKQGSVAEDYSAIQAATLIVGGWTDAYTNAVPRLLEHLSCERRGIIGPWGHVVPYVGVPGPAIGFLQECLRWFDRWLKGEDTGVERDPLLRVWINDSYEPAPFHAELPGRWTEHTVWPPSNVRPRRFDLQGGGVLDPTGVAPRAGDDGPPGRSDRERAIPGVQACGLAGGVWCANGRRDEIAIDQRADDELSACFDTAVLNEPVEVLGVPVVHLTVRSAGGTGLVAVRLCEVAPDGASTLVSWGLLSLAHRDSFETASPMPTNVRVGIRVSLNAVGHRFSAGNRIRLALSSTLWPHAWPSAHPPQLICALDGGSVLELPAAETSSPAAVRAFEAPESCPPGAARSTGSRTRDREVDEGIRVLRDHESNSEFFSETETTFSTDAYDTYRIAEDDPLSATTTSTRDVLLERPGWSVRVTCSATMRCDRSDFIVDDRLVAAEGDTVRFERTRQMRFPRGLL